MIPPQCVLPPLDVLFKPRGIAVIGASSDPKKLGHKLVKNIKDGGFDGKIVPVNIKGEIVYDIPSAKSVDEVHGDIDIAIICLPSKFVKGELEKAGKKGIPYAIIISAGFGETGNLEGELDLLEVAKKHGMRILGPNVFGLIYTPSSLNAQFGPGEIMKGKVAIITQSGALGAALMGKAFEEGIGVSGVVSTGNKADISDEELLEFFCSDPHTDAILIYMEGLKDGRRFIETVSSVSRVKPIIVVKSGTTNKGARAVQSHTASLAGNDRVFSGAFDQAGAIRAPTMRDAIDWTRTMINMPVPCKKEVLIITNGGGLGAIAVDELTKAGIPLFEDIEWIKKEMGSIFPDYATFHNPMDITAQVNHDTYLRGIKKAMEEGAIGSLIGIYAPTSGADVPDFTDKLIEVIGKPSKPVMICTFGGRAAMDQIQELKKKGISAFYYPEEAVSSLVALYRYSDHVNSGETSPAKTPIWTKDGICGIIQDKDAGFMEISQSLELLEKGPFTVAENRIVMDEGDLENISGFPVVLKAADREILHKSDSGGVITGIYNREDLKKGFKQIKRISSKVLVMEQVSGPELIIGALRDPVFGPVIMFGLGGTMVEILEDIVFRIAPLSRKDAHDMLDGIKSRKVLEGHRERKGADSEELADLLLSLSDLMMSTDRIEEMEINPLMLTKIGPIAVDARIKLN